MKSAYSFILAFLLLGLSAQALQAARKEFTKVIKKEYDISPTGTTALSNKYGRIEVKTWERNRVKIGVTIVVNTSSESKAQDVFDGITINFSNSPDRVQAETEIDQKGSSWFNWGSSKNDYAIHYEVYLPPTNNLELENKYGDVFVEALEGRGELFVKYGNFKVDQLGDDSRLNLAYGTGLLRKAGDLNGEVRYARLTLEDIKDLDIESKYSKIFIDRAGDIRSVSKYDNYELGAIRDLVNTGKYDNFSISLADKVEVNSKYTELRVDQLNRSLEVDMEYGGARVDRVSQGFTEILLEGRYSDFRIDMDSRCDFHMEAYAEYAGIRYPPDMVVEYEKEKGSSHQVRGHCGNASAGTIRASLRYGGLKVGRD
jgi:hypothetical protein